MTPSVTFEMRDGQPMPHYFIDRYKALIRAWGRDLLRLGPMVTIELDEAGHEDMSPNPLLGPVVRGVDLEAFRSPMGMRVTIRPASEVSEEALRRHVEKMQGLGIPAYRRAPRMAVN